MIIQEGDLRRNTSSAKQSRGQKMRSDIKSNVLDHFIADDKYQEGTGQRKVIKYLKGKLLPTHLMLCI